MFKSGFYTQAVKCFELAEDLKFKEKALAFMLAAEAAQL